MSDKLLNIEQAAHYLNVSKETLRNWDNDKKLISLKTYGGHRRYKQSELDLFIGNKPILEYENKNSNRMATNFA